MVNTQWKKEEIFSFKLFPVFLSLPFCKAAVCRCSGLWRSSANSFVTGKIGQEEEEQEEEEQKEQEEEEEARHWAGGGRM